MPIAFAPKIIKKLASNEKSRRNLTKPFGTSSNPISVCRFGHSLPYLGSVGEPCVFLPPVYLTCSALILRAEQSGAGVVS